MKTKKCSRCNHEWISRRDTPIQCPRCKSYNWQEKEREVVEYE